jgi:hypothetical protein
MLTVHVMCGVVKFVLYRYRVTIARGDATKDGRLLDFKYSTSSDMSTTFLFGRLCVGARWRLVTFRPSARGINDH